MRWRAKLARIRWMGFVAALVASLGGVLLLWRVASAVMGSPSNVGEGLSEIRLYDLRMISGLGLLVGAGAGFLLGATASYSCPACGQWPADREYQGISTKHSRVIWNPERCPHCRVTLR